MNDGDNLPSPPPGGPGPEIPSPNPIPETPSIDPINVPTPGHDVIFPGSGEPLGVPPTPGPDIPGIPTRPGVM